MCVPTVFELMNSSLASRLAGVREQLQDLQFRQTDHTGEYAVRIRSGDARSSAGSSTSTERRRDDRVFRTRRVPLDTYAFEDDELREAIDGLLGDSDLRSHAAAIGGAIRKEGGVRRAADLIEMSAGRRVHLTGIR
jgi:hypothetical protein